MDRLFLSGRRFSNLILLLMITGILVHETTAAAIIRPTDRVDPPSNSSPPMDSPEPRLADRLQLNPGASNSSPTQVTTSSPSPPTDGGSIAGFFVTVMLLAYLSLAVAFYVYMTRPKRDVSDLYERPEAKAQAIRDSKYPNIVRKKRPATDSPPDSPAAKKTITHHSVSAAKSPHAHNKSDSSPVLEKGKKRESRESVHVPHDKQKQVSKSKSRVSSLDSLSSRSSHDSSATLATNDTTTSGSTTRRRSAGHSSRESLTQTDGRKS